MLWVGVYRIPPRAKGAPPRGGPRHRDSRQPSADAPSKSRRVPESDKKASQNHDRIWNGFWMPKCSQQFPKMTPKTFKKSSKLRCGFRSSFWSDFASNFACFHSRPTYDLTAIYSIFVGCSIFREIGKVLKNDRKKASNMIPKSMQNRFKNRSKNKAQTSIVVPTYKWAGNAKVQYVLSGTIRKQKIRTKKTIRKLSGLG